jgi:hypothetical protein
MRSYNVVAWLFAAAACGAQSAKSTAPSPAASQSQELLPDEQVQQALNRLTFGARPGDAEKIRSMGVDKWIDLELHPSAGFSCALTSRCRTQRACWLCPELSTAARGQAAEVK